MPIINYCIKPLMKTKFFQSKMWAKKWCKLKVQFPQSLSKFEIVITQKINS